MKLGLRGKFTIIFGVFSVILLVAISIMTQVNYKKAVMARYSANASSIAKLAASYMDPEKMKYYGDTLEKDPEYEETQKILDNMLAQTNVTFLYVMYPTQDGKAIYLFDAAGEANPEPGYLGYVVEDYQSPAFAAARTTFETGENSGALDPTKTELGYLGSSYVPIKDKAGNSVAFVGVDVSMDEVIAFLNGYLSNMIEVMVVIIILTFGLLLFFVQRSIIKRILTVKQGVTEIASGNIGVQVEVSGRDEIYDIAQAFNYMSLSMGSKIREMQELNAGYHKFVPERIFQILQRSSVNDVVLGDQISTALTVSSYQTDGFISIVRKMKSKEMFDFINSVLKELVPDIMQSNGVIERFDKAGVVAFHVENSEQSIQAAIAVIKRARAQKKISYSVGITHGPVMLGIVGDQGRLAAIAISQQTTVANYLKKIAKHYRSSILITGTALEAITGYEKKYPARWLGFLHIESENRMEKIYDVYAGDTEEEQRLKTQTKSIFERGVFFYCSGEYQEARLCFIEVLKQFRGDEAAREYLYRCNHYDQNEETKGTVYIEEV